MYIFVKKKWFHRIVFGCDNENTREANKYSIDSILIVCDSLHGYPVAKWYQLISTSASFMVLWCATVSSWLMIRKLISRSQHIVPNLSPSNVQPRISSLFKKKAHSDQGGSVYKHSPDRICFSSRLGQYETENAKKWPKLAKSGWELHILIIMQNIL